MEPLTCIQAQALFSEGIDDRLADTQQLALSMHLAVCSVCAASLRAYGALQLRARELLRAESVVPAFVLPADQSFDRVSRVPEFSLRQTLWRRALAASVVMALCALVGFQLGRDSSGPTVDSVTSPIAQASFFPQRLKDHSDASAMLARQIMATPADAGEEAELLVERQLQLLEDEELDEAALRADWGNQPQAARTCAEYIRTWRQCAAALRQRLAGTGHTVQDLQRIVGNSRLLLAARNVAACTSDLPAGRWFASTEGRRKLQAICGTELSDTANVVEKDVAGFLAAHAELLSTRFDAARVGFSEICKQRLDAKVAPHTARIEPLARYMVAECYRRAGNMKDVMNCMWTGAPIELSSEFVHCHREDPVFAPILQLQIHDARAVTFPMGTLVVNVTPSGIGQSNALILRKSIVLRPANQCGDCGEHR